VEQQTIKVANTVIAFILISKKYECCEAPTSYLAARGAKSGGVGSSGAATPRACRAESSPAEALVVRRDR
jgi:hypothetical protein